MTTTTFEAFDAQARADGFDAVLERVWTPDQVVGQHSHPFVAHALIVQGEMWLTVGESTRHLRPGDTFDLDAGVPHDERYGPQGAIYWVARRNG